MSSPSNTLSTTKLFVAARDCNKYNSRYNTRKALTRLKNTQLSAKFPAEKFVISTREYVVKVKHPSPHHPITLSPTHPPIQSCGSTAL